MPSNTFVKKGDNRALKFSLLNTHDTEEQSKTQERQLNSIDIVSDQQSTKEKKFKSARESI